MPHKVLVNFKLEQLQKQFANVQIILLELKRESSDRTPRWGESNVGGTSYTLLISPFRRTRTYVRSHFQTSRSWHTFFLPPF